MDISVYKLNNLFYRLSIPLRGICARAADFRVLALSGAAVVSQSTSLSPGPQTWLRKLHRRGVTIGHNSANKEREGYEADQAHDQDHHNIDQTEWRSG